MKLKQIKPFNSETLTQDVVCAIIAVGGLWKAYNRDDYKSRIHTVTDQWYGVCKGSTMHSSDWNHPDFTYRDYVRTHHGVEINSAVNSHQFRIWPTGKLSAHHRRTPEIGEFIHKTVSRDGTYESIESLTPEYPCDQMALVQVYLDLGFYTIESNDD